MALHTNFETRVRLLYHQWTPTRVRRWVQGALLFTGLTEPPRVPASQTFDAPPYDRGFDRYRCIFIHIPKTAGASVVRTIPDIMTDHRTYRYYQKRNPERFANYFKFAFVRNPFDRLLSAYTYLKRGGINHSDYLWARKHLATYPDFRSFVLGWVNDGNIQANTGVPHFRPQHHFICDKRGALRVDFLGHFEQLAEHHAVVRERLGLLPLGHHNRTNHRHYRDAYDDEMVDVVRHAYHEDLAHFGYSF